MAVIYDFILHSYIMSHFSSNYLLILKLISVGLLKQSFYPPSPFFFWSKAQNHMYHFALTQINVFCT